MEPTQTVEHQVVIHRLGLIRPLPERTPTRPRARGPSRSDSVHTPKERAKLNAL